MNSIGKVLGVSFLCLPLGASVTYGTVAGLDLQKAKQQNEDLKQTNITISAENENLKADLEANLAKQEELKSELQTNEDALTLANTRISQIESDLNATNEELNTIKTEKQTLETNIANLTNDLTTANNELAQKQVRLTEIESLLAESEEDNETLLAEKTTLENEIISVRRQIDNLSNELSTKNTSLEEKENQIALLQNQNAIHVQQKSEMQTTITALNNTITELNAQIEELQLNSGTKYNLLQSTYVITGLKNYVINAATWSPVEVPCSMMVKINEDLTVDYKYFAGNQLIETKKSVTTISSLGDIITIGHPIDYLRPFFTHFGAESQVGPSNGVDFRLKLTNYDGYLQYGLNIIPVETADCPANEIEIADHYKNLNLTYTDKIDFENVTTYEFT